jgi:ankyrin repeat protein
MSIIKESDLHATRELIGLIEQGQADKAKELLRANPELAKGDDGEGWTPLISACRLRDVELVQLLLESGANANQRNWITPSNGEGDNFPLWFAANQKRPNRVEVATLLLEYGANVNMVGEFGETPLHQAAAWDNADIAEFLLQNGAYVNAEIIEGNTPLHLAEKYGFEEVATVLKRYGARPTRNPE